MQGSDSEAEDGTNEQIAELSLCLSVSVSLSLFLFYQWKQVQLQWTPNI